MPVPIWIGKSSTQSQFLREFRFAILSPVHLRLVQGLGGGAENYFGLYWHIRHSVSDQFNLLHPSSPLPSSLLKPLTHPLSAPSHPSSSPPSVIHLSCHAFFPTPSSGFLLCQHFFCLRFIRLELEWKCTRFAHLLRDV